MSGLKYPIGLDSMMDVLCVAHNGRQFHGSDYSRVVHVPDLFFA